MMDNRWQRFILAGGALVVISLLSAGPAAAVLFVDLSLPQLTPAAISPTGSDTGIFGFYLTSAGADTLTSCTVQLSGSTPNNDIDTVTLWIDANRSGQYEVGTDTVSLGVFSFVGPQLCALSSLSYAIATGADSFIVTVNLADTANPADTFQSSIPPNGVVCAGSGAGPAGPLILPGNWTVAAGAPPTIVVPSNNVIFPQSINPVSGDTGVIALSMYGSTPDTLITLGIKLTGLPTAADADTVTLWQDGNLSGQFEVAFDTAIVNLAFSGILPYWTATGIGYGLAAGSDSFVVTVDLRDGVDLADTFSVAVAADSVLLATSGVGPVAPLTQAGVWTVADSSGGAGGGADTIQFYDVSYGTTVDTYAVGDTAYIQLTDTSLNLNAGTNETTVVEVENVATGETESLLLSEVGPNNALFQGALPLSSTIGDSASNDGKLWVTAGDTLSVWDASDLLVDTVTIAAGPGGGSDTLEFMASGYGATAAVYPAGDTAYVELTDTDQDVNPGTPDQVYATVTNLTTNETETLLLLETANNVGIFRGELPLSAQSADSVSGSGALYVAANDTVTVSEDTAALTDTIGIVAAIGDTVVVLKTALPVPGAIDPTAGDTAVIGFSIYGAVPDTLTVLAALFTGSATSTTFDTIQLYADGNRNGQYEAGADTALALLTWQGASGDSESWGAAAIGYGMPAGFDSFIVTVNLWDGIALDDSFHIYIAQDSVTLATAGTGPQGNVGEATGNWTVADSTPGGVTTSVSLSSPALVPAVIDPAGADTGIIGISVYGATPDTLASCTVALTGALPNTDVDTVALYLDANQSGQYEPGVDTTLLAVLTYTIGPFWTSSALATALPTGSDSYVIVINLADAANSADTFAAGIETGGIVLSNAGASLNVVTLPGVWDVQDTAGAPPTLVVLSNNVIVPLAINPVSGDTGVIALSIYGSTPDTLITLGIKLAGLPTAADADTVTLWQDANLSGQFEAGSDTAIITLAFSGILPYWTTSGIGYVLATGADSFVVTVDLRDGVDLTDTFSVGVAADSVLLAGSGSGPAVDLTQAGNWTVADSGAGGGGADTIQFYDALYLTAVDTYAAGDTAFIQLTDTSLNLNGGMNETTVVEVENVATGETESVLLSENGPNTALFRGELPLSSTIGDSASNDGKLWVTAGDTLSVWDASDILVDTVTVANTGGGAASSCTVVLVDLVPAPTAIDPTHGETGVMGISIYGNVPDTLVSLGVSLNGSMPPTDVDTVTLRLDGDKNGMFDTAFDTVVALMSYTGSNAAWAANGIGYGLSSGSDSFIVTVDLRDGASISDTFIPGIAQDSVALAVAGSGPLTNLSVFYPWSVADSSVGGGGAGDTIQFMNFSYGIEVDSYAAGDTAFIQLTDTSLNLNGGMAETTVVEVENVATGETESVLLSEVGPNNALFRGELALSVNSADSASGSGALYVNVGDTLSVWDASDVLVDTVTVANTGGAGGGGGDTLEFMAPGYASPISSYAAGDTAYVELTDTDQDVNPGTPDQVYATVTNVATGETEIMLLLEIANNVGIFRGELLLSASGTDSATGSGALYVVMDDTVTVTEDTAALTDTVMIIPGGGPGDNPYLNLTDSAYVATAAPFAAGDTAYCELYDTAANPDTTTVETATLTVKNQFTQEVEYVVVSETIAAGLTLRGQVLLTAGADSIADNSILGVTVGQNILVTNESQTLNDSEAVVAGPSTVFLALSSPALVPAAIDPTLGDTGIIGFTIYGNTPDTVTGCSVTLTGSLTSAGVMMMQLWRDANQSGQYEVTDSWLATLNWLGSDSNANHWGWSSMTIGMPAGSDSFVITIDLMDGIAMTDTFAARIGAGNVVLVGAGRGPGTDVILPGSWSVADSTPGGQVTVAVTPDLVANALYLTGPDTAILAVSIKGVNPDTLASCTVTLTGLPETEVDSVTLWRDMDWDGHLGMSDQFIAVLAYSGAGYDWTASGINYQMFSGADSFVFGINLADTASLSDSFGASVGVDGIFLAEGGYGPMSPAAVSGTWTVTMPPPPGIYDNSVVINYGDTLAYGETVSLTIYGDTLAFEMMIDNDSAFGSGVWETYTTWKMWWWLGPGDGIKTVFIKFRSALGGISAAGSDSILLDGSVPAGATVTINNDDSVTATTSVTVQFGIDAAEDTTVLQYRVSEYPDAMGFGWQPFITSDTDGIWEIAYELTAFSDTKTIYFTVRDPAGNIAVATDTITLQAGVMPARGLMGMVTPGGDSVSLSWQPSVSMSIDSYNLYTDYGSGTVNYATPIVSLPGWVFWYETGPLPAPDTWVFAIRASSGGQEEQNTSIRTTVMTFSGGIAGNLSATLISPVPGMTIGGIMCYVQATVTGDSGFGAYVNFEYRASGGVEWILMPTSAGMSNPVWFVPYFTQWDISGLADGDYDLRAVVWNASETNPSQTMISVTKRSQGAEVYIDFNDTGLAQKEMVYAGDTVATNLSDTSGYYGVYFPPAALNLYSPTSITMQIVGDTMAGFADIARGNFDTGGAILELSLDNGTTNFTDTITVTIPYTDNNADSIIDGTRIRLELVTIYYYSEADGLWHEIERANTSIDAARMVILCYVNHFSKFASGKEYQGGDLGSEEGDDVPDGSVNNDDLKKMNGAFGNPHGNSNYNSDADIVTTGTSEGRIDEEDLFEFAEQYGQ